METSNLLIEEVVVVLQPLLQVHKSLSTGCRNLSWLNSNSFLVRSCGTEWSTFILFLNNSYFDLFKYFSVDPYSLCLRLEGRATPLSIVETRRVQTLMRQTQPPHAQPQAPPDPVDPPVSMSGALPENGFSGEALSERKDLSNSPTSLRGSLPQTDERGIHQHGKVPFSAGAAESKDDEAGALLNSSSVEANENSSDGWLRAASDAEIRALIEARLSSASSREDLIDIAQRLELI